MVRNHYIFTQDFENNIQSASASVSVNINSGIAMFKILPILVLVTTTGFAQVYKGSRGEVVAHHVFPEMGYAPIKLFDDAAKQVFENMTEIEADQDGIKKGRNIRCIRFGTSKKEYSCDILMKTDGSVEERH